MDVSIRITAKREVHKQRKEHTMAKIVFLEGNENQKYNMTVYIAKQKQELHESFSLLQAFHMLLPLLNMVEHGITHAEHIPHALRPFFLIGETNAEKLNHQLKNSDEVVVSIDIEDDHVQVMLEFKHDVSTTLLLNYQLYHNGNVELTKVGGEWNAGFTN